MSILIVVVALIVLGILGFLYANKDLSVMSEPFDGVGGSNLENWHGNILANQVGVSSEGLIGDADGKSLWYNYDEKKPGVYGKTSVEFKYADDVKKVDIADAHPSHPVHPTTKQVHAAKPVHPSKQVHVAKPVHHSHPAHPVHPAKQVHKVNHAHKIHQVKHVHPSHQVKQDPDEEVYGTWVDPMAIFPQNNGSFKTKRLVRNRDWANVLVGVPGATPEQAEKHLDKLFSPNGNKMTAADREAIYVDQILNDPIGNASAAEFTPGSLYDTERIQSHLV